MKLKYIIPSFVALLILIAGCNDVDYNFELSKLQLSTSYVTIPQDGGSTTITVNANDEWSIDTTGTTKWLNVSPIKGSAGKTKVTFTSPKAVDGHLADLIVTCGDQKQHLNVMQGLPKPKPATCQEVNAGIDGKTYMVTGVVGKIENDEWGNYWLKDATGSLYIYGTLNKKAEPRKFKTLGIESGDEITVQGQRGTYKGVPQLKEVMVVKINKSLIKVDSVKNAQLPLEGGEFVAYITCKGLGVSVDIPNDAKQWLSISSIKTKGKNAVVTFKAAANTGGDRKTTITFHTTDGKKDYVSEAMLTQKGAIVPATIAEFLAAKVGEKQYRVSGIITKIVNTKYGNFYIKDFSGETFVYGLANFVKNGYKEGDIVTLVGKRSEHNGNAQMKGAVAEKHVVVGNATIAELLAKADNNTSYFKVTGKITKITNPDYGNMTIKDETGEIFLYGVLPYFGVTGDARKGLVKKVGLKEGDVLTVIGYKTSHNDKPQLGGSIYVSHKTLE